MEFYLNDIYDLCSKIREKYNDEYNNDEDPETGVETILYINSSTALFLVKKIIQKYEYNIIEEIEDEDYHILHTDIPMVRLLRMTEMN
jgi:hypothetical protein